MKLDTPAIRAASMKKTINGRRLTAHAERLGPIMMIAQGAVPSGRGAKSERPPSPRYRPAQGRPTRQHRRRDGWQPRRLLGKTVLLALSKTHTTGSPLARDSAPAGDSDATNTIERDGARHRGAQSKFPQGAHQVRLHAERARHGIRLRTDLADAARPRNRRINRTARLSQPRRASRAR